jgi:glycerol kinase
VTFGCATRSPTRSSDDKPAAAAVNVLAIDQGTSATKALVICPDRGVLGTAEAPVRPTYGADGLVEQDPEALLASVLDAGNRALVAAGEPVAAVGLANQGETVLAWDPGSGQPLSPAIVWQDRRSAGVCARLADRAGELEQLTGLSLDPYFAAPKMAWLRENLTRDGVVTTSDAWLVHRLTGAFVTDASTASRTMLLDLDAADWSPSALEAFGLAGEQLPAVVDAAGEVGVTTAFGSGPVPLTGLLVDQQAALLAEGCTGTGDAKCTYGTGAFLLATLGGDARRSTAGLATSVAWRLSGATTYCLDGQAFTVASAVRWLVDLGVLDSAADIDGLAGSVPDSGGVTFVPALAGLGGPWWRSDVRGSITGLALETTPAHLVRALVEGVAAQVAELAAAAAADLGAPLTGLRVDGGLTRSRVLMQVQADLLGVPVEVYGSPDATALGVGAVARLGLNPAQRLADVLPPWTPSAVYEPTIGADQAAERRGAFRDAVQRLIDQDAR